MNPDAPGDANASLPEVVISKEEAVFRMDGRGRWYNRHGCFTHKRIIDHFNRSIRHDDHGYYLTQERSGIREKVYFDFEDTPLFAVQLLTGPPMQLVLNTGETIMLDPGRLFVRDDHLYQSRDGERIKFADRALMAMAPLLQPCADGYLIQIGDHAHPIPVH